MRRRPQGVGKRAVPGVPPFKAVVFDYGGVIAEEGFREGLKEIADRNGHDPEEFFAAGLEALYATGYVTGQASEAVFWAHLRRTHPIAQSNTEAATLLLARFRLRPSMMSLVRAARRSGHRCILLTDQTDWLERLERRDRFLGSFDLVRSSFRTGKSKRDTSLFDDLVAELRFRAAEVLFVDDTEGHVLRARERGLSAVLFRNDAPSVRMLWSLLGSEGARNGRDRASSDIGP